MYMLLLAIIYLAFISLGLPDSLLGSGWPAMQIQLNVPLSYASILSIVTTCGTIISALSSDYLTNKYGTGKITVVSVGLTALGLFGYSIGNNFIILILFSLPYGLGAGAVDAALNNYVALHFKSKHMSFLHFFWGLGACFSPYIMSYALSMNNNWQRGYRIVSLVQIVITFILFISLPLWKKDINLNETQERNTLSIKEILKIKGVYYVLFGFLLYCVIESICFLWTSSYFVGHFLLSEQSAAKLGSLFYLGMTIGRLLNGFVADKYDDKTMIRIGILVAIIGVLMIVLSFNIVYLAIIGVVIAGIGCGPIFPSIIHSTPDNFGKENSQSIIGVQMACAYFGYAITPVVFGLLAQYVSISIYPYMLLLALILLFIMLEKLNIITSSKNDK